MKKLLASAAVLALGLAAPLAANAATDTYQFSDPGYFTGVFSLDVTGGQATGGTGVIDVPGYAPESLTLITLATPGVENDGGGLLGYRANDGTDDFNDDTAVPIDDNGLIFGVGPKAPTGAGTVPVFGLNAAGSGFQGALFGHINGGPTIYEYNLNTSVTAVPEPASWAMMLMGFGALGAAIRTRRERLAAA